MQYDHICQCEFTSRIQYEKSVVNRVPHSGCSTDLPHGSVGIDHKSPCA